MPSLLTRRVFQCLILDLPLVHRGCLRDQLSTTHVRSSAKPFLRASNGNLSHRRNFWDMNMFRTGRRGEGATSTGPGIAEMTDLIRRQRVRARLPARSNIAEALTRFLKECSHRRRGVEDTQAALALESLRYCIKVSESGVPKQDFADERLVELVIQVLQESSGGSPAHVNLAKTVYEYTMSIRIPLRMSALRVYCHMLSQKGDWKDAVRILTRFESQEKLKLQKGTVAPHEYVSSWMHILKNVAATGHESNVLEVYKVITVRHLQGSIDVSTAMLQLYQLTNNTGQLRKWWAQYKDLVTNSHNDEILIPSVKSEIRDTSNNLDSSLVSLTHPQTVANLLDWCQRQKEIDFGNEIIAALLTDNPPLAIWNAIFVWAAANGKSVDEIDRMIGVMEQANSKLSDRSQWRLADVTTINALVGYAMRKRDPYMAERFISVGHKRGIDPDHQTFAAQMSYRLDIGDTDGALTAYKNLLSTHIVDINLAAINKLIVSLCRKDVHDFDTIMNVAADLSDRRAPFEADTVSELMKLHLSRDETHDVMDLLNTHASNFSSQDRMVVMARMLEFCTGSATSTTQAWETYNTLREFFDEITRSTRTEIMRSFFTRGRPDIAVHVFNHMRNHSRQDTTAVTETYIVAFSEIAKLKDLESLEVVHNQLKLDYNIEVNTALRNALMLAYSACDKPRDALHVWDDIVASKEGPSYKSVHLAFRACENSPFGHKEAFAIWDTLQRKNVEVDNLLWTSYLAALVAHGQIEKAFTAIEESETRTDLEVNVFLLGSLCIVAPTAAQQSEIEEWAKGRFPSTWAKLVAIAQNGESDNVRTRYAIDRAMTL